MNKSRLSVLIITLLSLAVVFFREPADTPHTALSAGETVLAFGDSLTYGTGVEKMQSYPSVLARSTGLDVINAGIPGELSAEGLARLGGLLQKHSPKLVILCHGGNDILRRYSRDDLRRNLSRMIQMSLDAGARVLLVGVPDFYMLGFATVDAYGDIADEKGVMYEGGVLSRIVTDTRLKSDRIHPNAEGYKMMAEAFLEVLKENGLID